MTDDYGDTLSSSDLVSRQYENLPYPPFTKADMLREEIWYKHETSTNVSFSSIRLEKVNHFLHKGEENFRYYLTYYIDDKSYRSCKNLINN